MLNLRDRRRRSKLYEFLPEVACRRLESQNVHWQLFMLNPHDGCGTRDIRILTICDLQAVEESERALAVVQARLLEVLKAKASQEAEAAAAKHAANQDRLRLEAEVGCAWDPVCSSGSLS